MPDSVASWPERLAAMEAEQSGDDLMRGQSLGAATDERLVGIILALGNVSVAPRTTDKPALERAYRAGWGACREWLPREPPEGLSAEERDLWCEGWSDAYDTPLDRRLSVDDLMRVGVL